VKEVPAGRREMLAGCFGADGPILKNSVSIFFTDKLCP